MVTKSTVRTAGNIIEEMLQSIGEPSEFAKKVYPDFKIRVACIKRRPPRHEYFEYIRDLGLLDIDRVFNKKPFQSTELTFVFPERWMGVAEQQAFMDVLCKHPDAKKIKQINIITSSALLISGFFREQIRIITFPDDDKYNGGT